MERELRKSQNILVVLGYGVIMFGTWSLFKSILTCTLDFRYIHESIGSMITAADVEGMNITREALVRMVDFITIAAILVLSLVDMLVRLRIGLSAVAEGKGKKRGRFYLFVTIILIILSVFSIYSDISVLFNAAEEASRKNDAVVSLLFEITSLIVVIQLVYYVIKVRKLSKAIAKGKE